jgi:hypothetical protein
VPVVDRFRLSVWWARLRVLGMAVTAGGLFAVAWLFRFNDPGGAFAGLTDDHFFYVVRGWQILFGELPVRDFVDHGAPLHYYVAAAVQVVFGRGTLSEVAFSTTMLAAGAAATFLLATRASGSLLAGLAGAAVQVLLAPRFYNYPKIVVYVGAIPALWWLADRPSWGARAVLALVTAVAFLFRHDHGVYVALATAALLVLSVEWPWRSRVRHAIVYGGLTLALLAPYLLFIQLNGGIGAYVRDAIAWTRRDREREPVVWPGLLDQSSGSWSAQPEGSLVSHAVAAVRDNRVAWLYYAELALPVVVLGLLALSRDGFRPGWPRAMPKLATVAILAIVLNAGFLRSPLEARLADPSVPHAVLLAWLLTALGRLLWSRASLRESVCRWALPARACACVAVVVLWFVVGVGVTADLRDRLESTSLTTSEKALERARSIADILRREWKLETWAARTDRPDLVTLSLYLAACTKPEDRVFVQPYMPQVLALARRGFAAGLADLRPGYFDAAEVQHVAIARMQRQSVPVVLLSAGKDLEEFRKQYPVVAAYFDDWYTVSGVRIFDERFGITLLTRKHSPVAPQFEALEWPCPTGVSVEVDEP